MLKGPYWLHIVCPHCGKEINWGNAVERFENDRMEIINCLSDEGGCDKDFLVKIRLMPIVETYDFIPKTWGGIKE